MAMPARPRMVFEKACIVTIIAEAEEAVVVIAAANQRLTVAFNTDHELVGSAS